MSEFEIFMWKYGLNIFSIITLIVVGFLHWKYQKEYKKNKEFLKHIK